MIALCIEISGTLIWVTIRIILTYWNLLILFTEDHFIALSIIQYQAHKNEDKWRLCIWMWVICESKLMLTQNSVQDMSSEMCYCAFPLLSKLLKPLQLLLICWIPFVNVNIFVSCMINVKENVFILTSRSWVHHLFSNKIINAVRKKTLLQGNLTFDMQAKDIEFRQL